MFRGLNTRDWLQWGTDLPLDRQQDPGPCLLLHAGDFPAVVSASPGIQGLGTTPIHQQAVYLPDGPAMPVQPMWLIIPQPSALQSFPPPRSRWSRGLHRPHNL